MAVYGVDYVLESYATYYFEADSPAEASRIARGLLYSDEFFVDHMRDDFQVFPIYAGDVCDNAEPFDGTGMEVTLERDEINKYVKED